MSEQRDPIEYLLNAMEHAVQSIDPAAAGYRDKRRAVLSAIAELRKDAERYRWLCEDHDDRSVRQKCREILDRMPVMSYSAASAAIDAARQEPAPDEGAG